MSLRQILIKAPSAVKSSRGISCTWGGGGLNFLKDEQHMGK